MIRLGGNGLAAGIDDPAELARAHRAFGYRAAYCPPIDIDDRERIVAVRDAFAREGVMIAEVHAWSNLVSGNEGERKANLDRAAEKLALADEIGALCAISYSGSIISRHDSPVPDFGADHQPDGRNLTKDGFERCVESARYIIDKAQPKRAKLTFEMMQFVYPNSVGAVKDLIVAIDRHGFGAHIDPVNIVITPEQYFNTGKLIEECFAVLGEHVVSCHAKDLKIRNELALHYDEVRLGMGGMDYVTYLRLLDRHSRDIPLLLEHLPDDQYAPARDAIFAIGKQAGVDFNPSRISEGRGP